ncbi:MAG: hypothetical protein ACK5Y2_13865 [Bdellovibrionales bacterium]
MTRISIVKKYVFMIPKGRGRSESHAPRASGNLSAFAAQNTLEAEIKTSARHDNSLAGQDQDRL